MAPHHSFVVALLFVIPSVFAFLYYGDKPFHEEYALSTGVVIQLVLFALLLVYISYQRIS
jgi:hypothetical protein